MKNMKKSVLVVLVVAVMALGVITVCGGGVDPGVGTQIFTSLIGK